MQPRITRMARIRFPLSARSASSAVNKSRFVLALAIVSAVSTGCGGSGDRVRVTGQLLKNGQPYTANLSGKEPETFAVDFVGTIKDHSYIFPATINSNGSFRVDGPDRRGIPKRGIQSHRTAFGLPRRRGRSAANSLLG